MSGLSSLYKELLGLPACFALGFSALYLRNLLLVLTPVHIPDYVDKAILVAGLLFLLMHCLGRLDDYEGSIVIAGAAVFFSAISYLLSGETSPLVSCIVIVAAATAGAPKRLIRFWFVLTVASLLFVAAVYITTFAISPNSIKIIYRDDLSMTPRFDFFYSHPNGFAIMACMLCATAIYLKGESCRFIDYSAAFFFDLMVFMITDSRTSCVLLAMVLVAHFYLKGSTDRARGIMSLFVSGLPFVLLFLTYLLSGPLFSESIRDLFSSRIGLWHSCSLNQGVTLFGQRFLPSFTVEANGWLRYYSTLDSFYASCLFVYGVPFTAFFFVTATRSLRRADEFSMTLLFFLFFAIGWSEGHLTNLAYCSPLLAMGAGVLNHPHPLFVRDSVGSVSRGSRGCRGFVGQSVETASLPRDIKEGEFNE